MERKDDESPMKLRYFDTVYPMNETCLVRADKVRSWAEASWPEDKENIFMQAGDDCAYWVMHYAEVEARMAHGEGLGLPGPRPLYEEAAHQAPAQAGFSAA